MEAGGGVTSEAVKKEGKPTEYLVLVATGEQDVWQIVEGGTVKEAVDKNGPGVYVQVPKRSWKPRTAKVEQVSKVTLD